MPPSPIALLNSAKKLISSWFSPGTNENNTRESLNKRLAQAAENDRPFHHSHAIIDQETLQGDGENPAVTRKKTLKEMYRDLATFLELNGQNRRLSHEDYQSILDVLAECVRGGSDGEECLQAIAEARHGKFPAVVKRMTFIPSYLRQEKLLKRPLASSVLRRPYLNALYNRGERAAPLQAYFVQQKQLAKVKHLNPEDAMVSGQSNLNSLSTLAAVTTEDFLPKPLTGPVASVPLRTPLNSFCGQFFYDDEEDQKDNLKHKQTFKHEAAVAEKMEEERRVKLDKAAKSLLNRIEPTPEPQIQTPKITASTRSRNADFKEPIIVSQPALSTSTVKIGIPDLPQEMIQALPTVPSQVQLEIIKDFNDQPTSPSIVIPDEAKKSTFSAFALPKSQDLPPFKSEGSLFGTVKTNTSPPVTELKKEEHQGLPLKFSVSQPSTQPSALTTSFTEQKLAASAPLFASNNDKLSFTNTEKQMTTPLFTTPLVTSEG